MKVVIGTCGFVKTTTAIIAKLQTMGHEIIDLNKGESRDAVKVHLKVARLINEKKADRGIIIDLYAQLSFMITTKFPHTMVAPVFDDYSAQLTAQHNNANIICLAGAILGHDYIIHLATTFMQTKFDAGRHLVRTEMMDEILKKEVSE